MRSSMILCLVLAAAASQVAAAQQAASRPIRGLRYPAVSPDGARIAFTYRGDLWTVSSAGGEAQRLTQGGGWDVRARWSPDGKTVAYSSDSAGNMDLFTIPATGGIPRQVTFHSADDLLSDWSPDGKRLVFYALRDSRSPAVYAIDVDSGRLEELVKDEEPVQSGVLSPDGRTLVFVRGRGEWARKGYRGSANADVWTRSLDGSASEARRLTTFPGHDMWPMFAADGRWVYYTSDADGTGNLWRVGVDGRRPVQITRQRDGFVHYPTISRTGRTIAYETDFSLWTVDPTARNPQPRRLQIAAQVADSPRREQRTLAGQLTELEISPTGSQLAVGSRGDIFLAPTVGGEAKRITDSPANDFDFDWAPDGKQLAFVSERGANQDIYLFDVETESTRRLTTNPEPERSPQVSPDGRWVAYLRGGSGSELVRIPIQGGTEEVIARGPFMSTARWSPDSRWLAFTRRSASAVTNVYSVPAAGGSEVNISRWTGSNTNPTWSPDGRQLFFFSDRTGTTEIFGAELTRSAPTAAIADANDRSRPSSAGDRVMQTTPRVDIQAEGLSKRVRLLAGGPPGTKLSLGFSPDGKSALLAVLAPTTASPPGVGPGRRGGFFRGGAGGGLTANLYAVPLGGGAPVRLAEGVAPTGRLSRDADVYYSFSPAGIRSTKLSPSGAPSGPVEVTLTASYEVDLADERREVFDQAWRLMRDHFYDPRMHGADWKVLRARYRPVVDECVDIKEFHLLLTELVGELNASHTGASAAGPDGRRPGGPPGIGPRGGSPTETASLGVVFDLSHSGTGLRIAEVMTEAGADGESRGASAPAAGLLKPGEFLLAIDGQPVSASERAFRALAGKAGTAVELTVNSVPRNEGARMVKMTAVSRARHSDLLYEQWVQRNRVAVERASTGRLAYLHLREMDPAALARFRRELLTEADGKEALVLDVRNNGGGRIHDELFALLAPRVHSYETPRGGLRMTQPFGAVSRPMILLINGGSFSDAEIFPNGFRALGLGKLVGVPTGGGVIGTRDEVLLDNQTRFRVPETGWETVEGRNLENWGVPPDFLVEITPADFLAGRDPQLERATLELLKELNAKKTGRR